MIWAWVGFLVLVLGLLALDLGVFHHKAHVVSPREAISWTVLWITLALAFDGLVYAMYEHDWLGITGGGPEPLSGRDAAVQYLTAYIVEKSLSLDNIFVMAMILGYFRVPQLYQHRVLFWGVLGALVMRGVMIGAGIAMIQRFSWLVYVLGGILIFTAGKMLLAKDETFDPDKSLLLRIIRRFYPVTPDFHEQKFFVVVDGRRAATPMFLTVAVIESSDVLFAVDSIPAVFSVTLDPFLVFTSNVFAILGLRSLYFALAAMLDRFRYLKLSLVVILAFIGVKMLASHYYHVPPLVSLGVIAVCLSIGVVASLAKTAHPTPPQH